MPEPTIVNVGVGGILALMILDKVLPYFKLGGNGSSGKILPLSSEQCRTISRDVVTECLALQVVPIMGRLADVLSRIEVLITADREATIKAGVITDTITVSLDRLRASNHELVNAVQRIASAEETVLKSLESIHQFHSLHRLVPRASD